MMPFSDVLRELESKGAELPFGEPGQLAVMRRVAPWSYAEVASAIYDFVPREPQPKRSFYGRAPGTPTIAYGYVHFENEESVCAPPRTRLGRPRAR